MKKKKAARKAAKHGRELSAEHAKKVRGGAARDAGVLNLALEREAGYRAAKK